MATRNEYTSNNNALFIEHEKVNPDATLYDLAKYSTWDPRGNEDGFLEQSVLAVVDDLEVLGEYLDQNDKQTARMVTRAAFRLRMAIEIQRRHEAAQPKTVANANHFDVPPDVPFFIVPIDLDGEPVFEQAKRATARDMHQHGWILATEARRAVSILIADQPEPTAIDHEVPEPMPVITLDELDAARAAVAGGVK